MFDASVMSNKDRDERPVTMPTSQTEKRHHQGPCICDDCGKQMQWEGIDWCIMNTLYLLCSLCTQRWFKENRHHKKTREESTILRKLSAVA